MRTNDNLRLTVTTAVLTALVCALTIFPQIPLPLTRGYLNLGDCLVIISGWLLGPYWGAAAGGIGSALADVLTGYVHYAPATLVIKGAMAVAAALIAALFTHHITVGRFIAALTAEIIMSTGYFLYSWFFVTGNFETSLAGIPANLTQGIAGLITSLALITALDRTKALQRLKLK